MTGFLNRDRRAVIFSRMAFAGGLDRTISTLTVSSFSMASMISIMVVPPTSQRQVTSADTDGVGNALAQTVDDGGQLLDTGSGSTDDADGAGSYLVGKCDRHALDDAGTAVRTHNSKSLCMSLLLQTCFVLDRDVVGEHEDVLALVERAVRFKRGICAGDGDDGQVGVRQLRHGLLPALDALGGLLAFGSGRLLLEELVHVLHDDVQHGVIVDIGHDDHVVGGGSHQLFGVQAALLENVLVGRCCHHDLDFFYTFDGGQLIGQKHQDY